MAAIAAVSSWIASFIHSSDVWCWMMNNISSGEAESGACAERMASSFRWSEWDIRRAKSVTAPSVEGSCWVLM
jgi:hypothetical protein